MPTYLITGASRGIGLELTKQLITSADNTVIATARKPSSSLTDLRGSAKPHILPLDVTDGESIKACAQEVKKLTDHIDYLLNNAGIYGDDDPSTLNAEDLVSYFQVNVVSQLLTVQALEPLYKKGTVIMNMSTGLSSLADTLSAHGSKATGYSISKAAVNMLSAKQAMHYTDLIVISLNPGWVQTDMGGPSASLTVQESASNILKTIHGLKKEDSGLLFSYDGAKMPF